MNIKTLGCFVLCLLTAVPLIAENPPGNATAFSANGEPRKNNRYTLRLTSERSDQGEFEFRFYVTLVHNGQPDREMTRVDSIGTSESLNGHEKILKFPTPNTAPKIAAFRKVGGEWKPWNIATKGPGEFYTAPDGGSPIHVTISHRD